MRSRRKAEAGLENKTSYYGTSRLPRRDQRQLNKTCFAGQMINPLCSFLKISRLRPKDVLHKRLRVAIIERKPTRLNLDHDSMPRQKDMVRSWQGPAIKQRLVRRDRFGSFQ